MIYVKCLFPTFFFNVTKFATNWYHSIPVRTSIAIEIDYRLMEGHTNPLYELSIILLIDLGLWIISHLIGIGIKLYQLTVYEYKFHWLNSPGTKWKTWAWLSAMYQFEAKLLTMFEVNKDKFTVIVSLSIV